MPYLGSTVFFGSLVVSIALAMSAWWLAMRSLAPGFVERARERWRRPITTVLLGAIVGGAGTIASVLLLSMPYPLAKLLGGAIATGIGALALAGTAGLAALIGRGLASPSDEGREWFQCVKGGLVLELTFFLPILGWLVWMPIALFGGVGASLLGGAGALFARRARVVRAAA